MEDNFIWALNELISNLEFQLNLSKVCQIFMKKSNPCHMGHVRSNKKIQWPKEAPQCWPQTTSNSPKLWELVTSIRPKFTRVSRWNSQKNNYGYCCLTKAIFAFATSRSVKNWHKRTKVERQIVPLNTTWI